MSDEKGYYLVKYENNGQDYCSEPVYCLTQAVDMFENRISKYGNGRLVKVGEVEMVLRDGNGRN